MLEFWRKVLVETVSGYWRGFTFTFGELFELFVFGDMEPFGLEKIFEELIASGKLQDLTSKSKLDNTPPQGLLGSVKSYLWKPISYFKSTKPAATGITNDTLLLV